MMTGIIFYSCTYDKVSVIKPSCNTPATVSFNNDILPIFQNSCSTSGCHTGTSLAGNLNLEAGHAFISLMKPGSGYLDTINPNYSLLYSQMKSASKPMPPSGNLDDCKTSLILKWIQQKAKNN